MLNLKLQTLATWCEELAHLKRPWCWERLRAGRKLDDRGWDGWMASPTWWTWVWVDSGSWWWTGRPGVLWFMGLQRVTKSRTRLSDWTELTEYLNGLVVFLTFFKSEFCNEEFMIWATVTYQSYFCWLYRASPSLTAKNIINLISVLTIWWFPSVESSLVLLEEGVCF